MSIRKHAFGLALGMAMGAMAVPAEAVLIGVSGPNSSSGTAPAIIAAPADILDDIVTNNGMQGFDEAQGVVLTSDLAVDGGTIAANTRVSSHMIFLNSSGTSRIGHFGVDWTFDGIILGVMSDKGGTLEAASSSFLGAPGTNYTITSPGSGPAAPFNARGLEANDGTGLGPNDGYAVIAPNTLRVGMLVTEPGDWIRVVTAATPVPAPGTLALLGLGLLAGAGLRRRQRG